MADRLTIGFDAKRIVRNRTGLGSYGRTLVNDLSANERLNLRLYAPDPGHTDLRSQVVERENTVFCYPQGMAKRLPGGKWLWRSRGIVADLKRDGVELYHGLSGELPLGIRRSGIRSVVTIHDLIFLRHPEYYRRADVKIYAWKFRQTLREADHIVAISECTKRDIVELGGIDESRITVIYQSFAPRFSNAVGGEERARVRQLYGLPARYVLSVGTIEERKNILLAVKALPRLPEDVALVAVGRHTAYTDTVMEFARRNNLQHRVLMLHNVPNEHLPALYAEAEVFVYPSRYEGFGIPVVEAVSTGLPVVACKGSCLEEAGGPDCLYVDADDEEALAAAVTQMLCGAEGRTERIARSRQYISRFENTRAAQQITTLYEQLLMPSEY